MTDILVRTVEAYEYAAWDAFIKSGETGTLFHTSLWKSVIETTYANGTYSLIGAYEGDRLVGGFCALTRTRLGVATAVTPLSTPYTGFVSGRIDKANEAGRDDEILKALALYLRRFRYQNVQCVTGLPDLYKLVSLGYKITPRYTLDIDLQQPEEKLWAAFEGSVRRNIKKAAHAGFEINGQWDGKRAYEIFGETFVRHREACPVPQKLFQEIADETILTGHRRRYCAWRDGRLEAFLVALRYHGIVYYELAGTGTVALKSGISSLLIWEMLKDHLDGNWETFDFVGANDASITRFKNGFHPSGRTYLAAEYCSSRRIRVARKVQRVLQRR